MTPVSLEAPSRGARGAAPRPRLALVLGSGGVRSVAAVGVADVLREAGLAPDLVAGCSSGALFGATIAMGLSAKDAIEKATTLWSAELTQQKRWKAYAQLVMPRLAGFDTGFALRDDRLIDARVRTAFGELMLEHLPTPLRVVATEAATGLPVTLERGRVADAVRASMAVPFIFPSVEVDGRRLVDGVVSDPLPVSAAGDAELVVTLGFEGTMPRRVDRASRLVGQVTTTMINNLQRARVEAAQAAGRRIVALELQLERPVGLWDTRAITELFYAGRRAAQARLGELQALVDGLQPRQDRPRFRAAV